MKNREKKAGKRLKKSELANQLISLFRYCSDEALSFKDIVRRLSLTTHPLKMLCSDILSEMLEDEFIVQDEHGEFIYSEKPLEPRDEHIGERFVGTLKKGKYHAFLLTNSKVLHGKIFLPQNNILRNAHNGDKAIVEIQEWPVEASAPIGKMVEVLGAQGENEVEMHAILAEFGLPYRYPQQVEKAANDISDKITKADYAEREDFRETTTFTIDPRDAKDFDDALSIKSLKPGLWEVGVHIADVTHYVAEGSIIDEEAQHRATSVYLVDRTIPMLPERLCNMLCSLRPDEEKLAYSVVFTMNDNAEVLASRICHTVIKSNRRFTYEEAQQIIETSQGDYKDEVLTLNRLAQILRQQRFKQGSIDFDRVEVRFEIDNEGKPISVYFKESKEANQLIEEFMLLANKTVAEFIGKVPKGKKAKTFPYRVHDLPDLEKLESLNAFVARFGYKVRTSGTQGEVCKSLNKLLDDVKDKKEKTLVEMVTLKAMQKAYYSTHNIGHYGLQFDYYTHFTSPIRRYPDMMVHRLLSRYIDGGRSASLPHYEELCKHSSDMEQVAANAERASIKYKQVEFMTEHLGEEFEATVSGVTDWGLYVEVNENKCEGLIPIRTLSRCGEHVEFDEKNFCLRGYNGKILYSLGDPIHVRVSGANLEKRQLNFELVKSQKQHLIP